MSGFLGVAGFVVFLGYGLLQIYAGFLGIEYYFGLVAALLAVVAFSVLRFSLPITVGAFFGAMDVWGWHWALALVFAAPGLVLVVPGILASVVEWVLGIFTRRERASSVRTGGMDRVGPKTVRTTGYGALVGAALVFISGLSSGSFPPPNVASWIGGLLGGAIMGAIVGAIIGFLSVPRLKPANDGRAKPHSRSSGLKAGGGDPPVWFIADARGERGPFTSEELISLRQQGHLTGSEHVWREGFQEWVVLSSRSELEARLTAPQSTSRRNYIFRHWRGELSLPVSFWLNTILSSIALVVVFFSTNLLDVTNQPKLYSATAIAVWASLAPIQLWLSVGIWRSANAYSSQNPQKVWGGAAKFLAGLWLLSTGVGIVQNGIPQITEYVSIMRAPATKQYTLRVIRDGRELELSGQLDFGIGNDVSEVLRNHPTIETVHLNSNGGRLAEAEKIRELVLSRKLNTYVASGCASACVSIFAAGENRWISRGASIGLHAPYFPGTSEDELKVIAEADKAWLLSRGISAKLVERGFGTPHTNIWEPTHLELFASNLATSYATDDQVALSGIKLSELDQLEGVIRKVPLYEAIRQKFPEDYQHLIQFMKQGFLRGQSLNVLRQSTIPIVTALYEKALPTASDVAIYELYQVILTQGKLIRKIGYPQCAAFFKGDFSGYSTIDLSSTEDEEMKAGEEVVKSMGSYHGDTVSVDALVIPMQTIFSSASANGINEDALINGVEGKLDSKGNCEGFLIFIEAALKLPHVHRSAVLRYMAQNAEN